MTSIIHSIFLAKNLAVSIATYFKLVESVDNKIDQLISKEFNSAIVMLEQVKQISTPNIYNGMLVMIIDRFNQAVSLEKRERLLLSYLGLMISYYYLGETQAIRHIQQKVSMLEFDMTFWEKYGGDIEHAGMVVLGVGSMFFGGGNIGAGGAMGHQSGQKMNDDHAKELQERMKRFNNMKDGIVAINFR